MLNSELEQLQESTSTVYGHPLPPPSYGQSKSSPTSTLPGILFSAFTEFYAVLKNATQICCAVGVVAVVKDSVLGRFYWPLKIGAMVKVCFLPIRGRSDAFIGAVTDVITFFVFSATTTQLSQDYLAMNKRSQKEYNQLYTFILGYLYAIQADFLVRSGYLLYAGWNYTDNEESK